MKKNKSEKNEKRYFILKEAEKMNPVLMSDRSFYSEAYGSFANICGRD
ncbi:MAG: hypothetical protein NC203_04985 [Firmicutes bacterium]|nr:hypothetical protein [Bacillota bacterium]